MSEVEEKSRYVERSGGDKPRAEKGRGQEPRYVEKGKDKPEYNDREPRKDKDFKDGPKERVVRLTRFKRTAPRVKFNFRKITLQTQVPKKPESLVARPSKDEALRKVEELEREIGVLHRQKRMIDQSKERQIETIKSIHKLNSQVSEECRQAIRELVAEKREVKKRYIEYLEQLRMVRERIRSLRKEARGLEGRSKEEIRERIEDLKLSIMRDSLSKQEEARIQKEIFQLEREIEYAEPLDLLEHRAERLQGLIEVEEEEQARLKTAVEELREKLEDLDQLIEEQGDEGEKKVTKQKKSKDEIIAENKKNQQQIQAQIDALIARKKLISEEYWQAFYLWEDQEDLLDYIDYVLDEQDYLRAKLKEKERRLKEKEERQRKQKEWELKQEERKKAVEEAKQRRQKERQEKHNAILNEVPFKSQIKKCHELLNYLQGLKDTQALEKKVEVDEEELRKQFQKEWGAEIKKGMTILKKRQIEEPRSGKKRKGQKKEKRSDTMTHSAFIVSIFDELRVLPPSTKETIEETEASVRAKLQEFSSPSAEVVEQFKQAQARRLEEEIKREQEEDRRAAERRNQKKKLDKRHREEAE